MDALIDAPSVGTFERREGDSFSVESGAGGDLELASVERAGTDPSGFERFTLVFRGGDGLESGTHRLSADGLDPFDVGLSPTPRLDPERAADSESPPVEYEAVFTRHDPDGAGRSSGDSEGGDATSVATPQLSTDSYLGAVSTFAGNFAPSGFMVCAGQELPIKQYNALFSILGTTYGGDGRSTFELPDLRSRVPVGAGSGSGLSRRELGQQGGRESVSLTREQLAPHTHDADVDLPVSNRTGDATSPDGNALAAQPRSAGDPVYTSESADGSMPAEGRIEQTGSGRAHDNMPPFLALTHVVSVSGPYPSRN